MTTAIPAEMSEDSASVKGEDTQSSVSQNLISASIDMSWLRPIWLGPYLWAGIFLVHAAIAAFFLFTWEKPAIPPMIEISISIPQGEVANEESTVAAPQTAPLKSPDPPTDTAPEIADRNDPDVSKPSVAEQKPETAPSLSAELPKIEQPDAPPLPVAKPGTPVTEKPQPTLEEKVIKMLQKEKQEAAKRAAMKAARLAQARAHAKQLADQISQGAEARHVGVRDGTGPAAKMSDAAYAVLVGQELKRHLVYPSAASGAVGRVGMLLSVGPSGAISSHSIISSSGNAAFDAAANQAAAASHLTTAPPGGHFKGSISIGFTRN